MISVLLLGFWAVVALPGAGTQSSHLLLGLAACSESDRTVTPTPAQEQITGAQVEMMVFSGRPNPRWTLTTEEQERMGELLAQAAPADSQPIEGQLGYTGFNLTLQTATERRMLRIYDSVIMETSPTGITFYRDERRGLERFLLETGKPHIDPGLYQSISETIPAQ